MVSRNLVTCSSLLPSSCHDICSVIKISTRISFLCLLLQIVRIYQTCCVSMHYRLFYVPKKVFLDCERATEFKYWIFITARNPDKISIIIEQNVRPLCNGNIDLVNCSDEFSLVDHHGTHSLDTVNYRRSAQRAWIALAIAFFLRCSDRLRGWLQHSCSARADHWDHSHRVLLDRVQSHQM